MESSPRRAGETLGWREDRLSRGWEETKSKLSPRGKRREEIEKWVYKRRGKEKSKKKGEKDEVRWRAKERHHMREGHISCVQHLLDTIAIKES